MANRFTIVIDASDKATQKIRKVKQALAGFMEPEIKHIQQTRRNIGLLGASVSRLSRETGITRVAKALGSIGPVAVSATAKIFKMAAAVGGLIGLGSIAAIAAYARNWATTGATIARAAYAMGMGARGLQSLEGAAQIAGLPVGALTNGLKTLGDTMQDAFYGRNQDALVVLNRLGVSIKKTKDGSIDLARALPDVAEGISKLKSAQARGLAARILGVEDLLPFLAKGRKGIAEYQAMMKRTGAIMSDEDLQKAAKFNEALIEMKMTLVGLGNTIMSKLGPELLPYMDSFSKWLQANRQMITSGFTAAVKNMAKALEGLKVEDLINFARALERAATTLAQVFRPLLLALKVEGWFEDKTSRYITRPADRFLGTAPGQKSGTSGLSQAWNWLKSSVAPVGVRRHNPGNLTVPGSFNEIRTFGSDEEGMKAFAAQLRRHNARGLDTIGKLIATYAPAKAGNNVPAYVADVVHRTGIGADEKLNFSDGSTLSKLMKSMINHEQGGVPYSDALINNAASTSGGTSKTDVKIELKGVPAGMSAQATTRNHETGTIGISNLALGGVTL